jgi:hypothetical protein
VNNSLPARTRFAQSYVFTVNDAFVFIFSVGGQQVSQLPEPAQQMGLVTS